MQEEDEGDDGPPWNDRLLLGLRRVSCRVCNDNTNARKIGHRRSLYRRFTSILFWFTYSLIRGKPLQILICELVLTSSFALCMRQGNSEPVFVLPRGESGLVVDGNGHDQLDTRHHLRHGCISRVST